MEAGDLAVSLAGGRIAIGVLSLLAPGLVGRAMVSAVVDGIDAGACLLARRHLRTSVFPAAVGLASAGALFSGWLSRELDAPRSSPSGQPGFPNGVVWAPSWPPAHTSRRVVWAPSS